MSLPQYYSTQFAGISFHVLTAHKPIGVSGNLLVERDNANISITGSRTKFVPREHGERALHSGFYVYVAIEVRLGVLCNPRHVTFISQNDVHLQFGSPTTIRQGNIT